MPTFKQKRRPAQQTKSNNSTTHGPQLLGKKHTVPPILNLQRTIGNQAVNTLVSSKAQPAIPETGRDAGEEKLTPQQFEKEPGDGNVITGMEMPRIPLDAGFQDMGRVATAPFGEQANRIGAEGYPQIFINGGRTGTVVFAGGGGAGPHGNQGVGTIQASVVPVYDSRSLGLLSDSEAWVRAGTGSLTVRRSYVGMAAGNQGNGYYVTPRAAARADQHEAAHVTNSRGHYNTFLQPLLNRIRDYTPAPTGGGRVVTSFFQLIARIRLAFTIGWTSAINSFRTADTADNRPMGTIDQNYLASPTTLVDSGPGTVGGTAYQHRVHVLTEPTPT